MVDPLEIVLAYLRGDEDLVTITDNQITVRHRYALPTNPWLLTSKALTVQYTGIGEVSPDVAWERIGLDARCYGPTEYEAAEVYGVLVEACRLAEREVVTVEDGSALLYWLIVDGAPRGDIDPDTGMHYVAVILEAATAEEAVA